MPSPAEAPKQRVHVNVADMKLSTSLDAELTTYGLGPCIGITFFDPRARVGALLHAQLPLARANASRALASPFTYVDRGIIETLRALAACGADRQRLVVHLAGGAAGIHGAEIGPRNVVVAERMMERHHLLVVERQLGGNVARTMTLDLASGRTSIRAVERVAA